MFLYRKIEREKFISLLKVLIMGIGVASSLVLFYIAINEYNTDSFYKDKNRIFQCFADYKSPDWSATSSHLMQPFIPAMVDYFPEIKYGTVVFNSGEVGFEYKGNMLKAQTLYADSLYFKIFDRKILEKKSNIILSQVNQAVVTKQFADKYFGSEETAVSKVIKLNGARAIEITAVIENWPPNSSQNADVIISFATLKDEKRLYMGWGGGDSFQGYIKLAKNASASKVEKEMPIFVAKYVDLKAEEAKGMFTKYMLIPIADAGFVANPAKKVILILMLFIGLLIMGLVFFNTLLINLSASDKFHKTTAIHRVLGASNFDLQKYAFKESFLFLIATAFIAFFFLWPLQPIVSVYYNFNFFELLLNHSYAWIAFLSFSAVFSVNYLVQLNWILRPTLDNKSRIIKFINSRFQKTLLTLQIGISFSLFVFLYFIHSQLSFAYCFDKGYDSDNLIYIELNNEQLYKNHKVLKEEVGKLKNVKSVCLSDAVLTQGLSGNGFYADQKQENLKIFRQIAVDADFFKTMGMDIKGECFTENRDEQSIIVNEEVGKIINHINPIGQFLYRGGGREIIAVVPNFISGSVHAKMEPAVFVKYTQPSVYSILSIRIAKDNQMASIDDIIKTIDKIVPEQHIQPRFYNADIDQNYKFDRSIEKTMSFFTFLALLITASGLIGFSINMVHKRTKEIGIRKVNGASVVSILILLNKQFILNIIFALLLFVPISYFLVKQWLTNYAYAVSESPLVFVVASILLALFVLFTVSLTSLHYARINPVKTLKYE